MFKRALSLIICILTLTSALTGVFSGEVSAQTVIIDEKIDEETVSRQEPDITQAPEANEHEKGSVINNGMAKGYTESGSCGFSLRYYYDKETQTLKIYGTGEMNDYSFQAATTSSARAPWRPYRLNIRKLILGNGVEYIGTEAFYGFEALSSVIIPDSVETIGSKAFSGCKSLTSVTIGNSVQTVGFYAFSGCKSLTSVTIGNSVQTIGFYAFSGCKSLSAITLPPSVENVEYGCFSNCSSLSVVDITSGDIYFGYNAFANCTNISTVYVDNLSAWRCCSFQNETADPTWENGKLYIRDDSERVLTGNIYVYSCDDLEYSDYTKITGVTFSRYCDVIPRSMFYNCRELKIIDFGDSMETIAEYAFAYCVSLKSVDIPNSVTSMGYYVFEGCSSLETVYIGANINELPDHSFYGCTALNSVSFGSYIEKINYNAFEGCTSLTEISLGNSIKIVEAGAFYNSGITTLHLSDSIERISVSAFDGCNIKDVYVNKKATWDRLIKDGMLSGFENAEIHFNYCDNGNISSALSWIIDTDGVLKISGSGSIPDYSSYSNAPWYQSRAYIKSIVFDDSVTSVGSGSFYDLKNLESVHFGTSVSSVSSNTFLNCPSLTEITVDINNEYYFADENGVLYNKDKSILIKYPAGRSLQMFNIPDSVKEIESYSFYASKYLTSIFIPSSVVTIKDSAFDCCESLTDVYISDIEFWFNIVFSNSNSNPLCYAQNLYLNGNCVNELVIPSSVTSINEYAFYGYMSLTDVVFHDDVNKISDTAFAKNNIDLIFICGKDSYALTYAKNNKLPYRLTDGNPDVFGEGVCGESLSWKVYSTGVLHISGSGTMYDFYGSGSVNMPWKEQIPYIRHIIIDDSVINIGSGAFYRFTALMKVTMGDYLINIGKYAFYDCDNLIDIGFSPCLDDIGEGAFYDCDGIKNIELLSAVSNVGNSAFCSCDALETLSMSNGINNIGDRAFKECVKLTKVIFPDSVEKVGEHAFENCTSLSEVYLGYNMEEVGQMCFRGCTSLNKVTVSFINTKLRYWCLRDCASDLVVYCPSGSRAQSYCWENDIRCVSTCEHRFVNYVADNNGDCYTPATKTAVCENGCGATHTVVIDGSFGHKNDEGERILEPTCTVKGSIKYTCTVCGISYTEAIPTIPHVFEGYVYNNDATCSSDGTETGVCSYGCNTTDTRSAEGTMLPHTYTSVQIKESSCEDPGIILNTCECGYSYESEAPILGHSYMKYVYNNDATCYKDGTKTANCEHEGCPMTDTMTARGTQLTHEYGDWTLILEPTTTAEGREERSCRYCGDTESRAVAKLAEFSDVKPGHWFASSVEYCVRMGYVTGMSENTFAPNGNLTRAQFLTLLAKLDGVDLTDYEGIDTGFDDVKISHWYNEVVCWAVANEFTSGLTADRFGPNANITRAQLARFLYVYSEKNEINTEGRADISSFPDASKVAAWARTPVEWAVNAGLISGVKKGDQTVLSPNGTATRAQATVMFRAFDDFRLK